MWHHVQKLDPKPAFIFSSQAEHFLRKSLGLFSIAFMKETENILLALQFSISWNTKLSLVSVSPQELSVIVIVVGTLCVKINTNTWLQAHSLSKLINMYAQLYHIYIYMYICIITKSKGNFILRRSEWL